MCICCLLVLHVWTIRSCVHLPFMLFTCSLSPASCRETPLGAAFFSSVATPRTVKNILCQAYANDAAVTDELVEAILKPGLQVSKAKPGLQVRPGKYMH